MLAHRKSCLAAQQPTEKMRTTLVSLAQILGIVMLADFVAGLFHWLEDAYFDEDTPVIGPQFIKPNIVHHHYPRFFTRLSWWQSSADLLLAGLVLLTAAWWCGFLSWQLALFAVVSVNANQIHKWSHRTRTENGRVISFFQDIRVLQTPRHHALHHTDPKNTFYCPITNLVNPLLERIAFWDCAERCIERVTGLRHRQDTSNRGQGPGPVWLIDYRALRPDAAPTAPVAIVPFPSPCRNCQNCAMSCPAANQRAA